MAGSTPTASLVAHPSPAARLALDAPGQVNAVLQARTFPFVEDGWFVFLHHDPELRLASVRLLHGLRGWREPPVFERRTPGVHVLGLHVPEVNRLEYRLRLEDHDGGQHDVADPLNPLAVEGPFGHISLALGPGYAAPVHARPPVAGAEGQLSCLRGPIAIDHRGRRRSSEAFVWDPPGFDRREPLPLLIVLDGSDYLRFACMRRTLENLVHDGAMSPCRAVFLPPVDRMREYSANPAFPKLLAAALPEVLLGSEIPVDVPIFGVGASLGGLALLHAHVTGSSRFDGLLLQSGSFFGPATDAMESGFPHFERVTDFVASVLEGNATAPPIPIRLTCGAGEENLVNNRAMLDALHRMGVPVELALVADAHNWTAWRNCIGPGLTSLLPPP